MEKESLYIFNFSKFLLALLFVISLFGFLFDYLFEKNIILKSEISGAYKVNRILNSNNKNEIVILGSSRAEGSFVPSIITEKPCFNYGISGTKVNIWLFFLEQELKKNKSTDIIINLDLDGLLYEDGDINNYLPNYTEVKHVLETESNMLYNIPFVKYFGEFESYTKYFINNKLNLTKKTESGGSFEKNTLTTAKFQELIFKRKKESSNFTFNEKLLKKLNYLLKSTKRKIIFVIAPYHSSFFESYINIKEANLFFNNLNRNKNVVVLNLKNYIISDSLFINTSHVNYKGAIKFSEKLKTLLNDKKIMEIGYNLK